MLDDIADPSEMVFLEMAELENETESDLNISLQKDSLHGWFAGLIVCFHIE